MLQLDLATGAITFEDCDCRDFNACHVEAGNASFFAVGFCPEGDQCLLVSDDSNNDGIDDRFSAVCVPDRAGICCVDIDDGPIAFDTCLPSDANTCPTGSGIFHDNAPSCDEVQACCMAFAGLDLCVDMHPSCCMDSGGVPLGEGSTCIDLSAEQECPEFCGGFAGFQCQQENEFCMLPVGACCCDFMGVCAPIPVLCPLVWDPVCGCDGRTYSNACEAAAAEVSIDHVGICESGACCLPDAAGNLVCAVTTVEACLDKDGSFLGVGTSCPIDPSIPCGLPTGACCLSTAGTVDPVCIETTAPKCLGGGGAYLGDGTICPPNGTAVCPPQIGACCVLDPQTGTSGCFEGTSLECDDVGGKFLGNGTTCSSDPDVPCGVPLVACCFPDGSCFDLTPEDCISIGLHPDPSGAQCAVVFCVVGSTGACCLENSPNEELCVVTEVIECADRGGLYQGAGTACADVVCPVEPTGACCLKNSPDGEICVVTDEQECIERGVYQGDDTECTAVSCPVDPTGACCLENSPSGVLCVVTGVQDCVESGGAYQGDDTDCPNDTTFPCGLPTGACCIPIPGSPEPVCVNTNEGHCVGGGGSYLGNGTTCPADGTANCPPTIGACCVLDPSTGTSGCFEGTPFECANVNGEFLGLGTTCPTDANIPCGVPVVACCLVHGICEDLPLDVCLAEGGEPHPLGATCADIFCPPPSPTGACCLENAPGVAPCLVMTEAECFGFGGAYKGDNTECPTDPTTLCGPPTGACCVNAAGSVVPLCVETSESQCINGGGDYLGDGTKCPPDGTIPCPAPAGACCLSDSATNTAQCIVVTALACAGEDGAYLGDGTECPSDPNSPCVPVRGACCFSPLGTLAPVCAELSPDECGALAGEYLGDGTSCPDDPSLACPAPCPRLCPFSQDCFASCGKLIQGVECVLFAADNGGVFVVQNLGDFAVGDRVFVFGCLDPNCATPCQEGNACIVDNTIEPCGTVCGGIAGVPCTAGDEFCKFPIGTCGDGDFQGICTPIPGGGCPENFDPVCGCDGVTYGNECESDAAGVSIAHRGTCDMGECAAERVFGDPDPNYCPGEPKKVQIVIHVPDGATVIAVEDSPPAGWTVVEVNDDGTYDAANQKVKWGPFFAPFPTELTYVVVPTSTDAAPKCFGGLISIDGLNRDICGDQCVGQFCRPFMPPDLPQAMCTACPLGGCVTCDGGSCRDGRISLCEVIGYACSWKTGCNDDLSGMTRAAFIWTKSECYCWSEAEPNWFPATCPPPTSGLCLDVAPKRLVVTVPSISELPGATATPRIRVVKHPHRGEILFARIPIVLNAPDLATAVALELHLPEGWQVIDISDGGEWDEVNRKVKWGPYFDDLSRNVLVTAKRQLGAADGSNGGLPKGGVTDEFEGTVSFDGVDYLIVVR